MLTYWLRVVGVCGVVSEQPTELEVQRVGAPLALLRREHVLGGQHAVLEVRERLQVDVRGSDRRTVHVYPLLLRARLPHLLRELFLSFRQLVALHPVEPRLVRPRDLGAQRKR